MLLDMRTVARRASSGTVLAVSVQCTKADQAVFSERSSEGQPTSLDNFSTVFGRQRIPHGTTSEQLYGWQFGTLSRELLLQEIQSELSTRNSDPDASKIVFRSICDIEYEDGAKMTTLVGIFHTEDDQQLVDQCHFEALDFLPIESGPVRVTVPKLTLREFKKLESQLPLQEGEELVLGTIPLREARRFAAMYRYFPSFAVLEG